MSENTNAAGQTTQTPTGPTAKELRKKYGVQKTPLLVAATTHVAFRKDTNFDERFSQPGTPEFVKAESWVLIDNSTGIVRRATTYNSNLGDREDYMHASRMTTLPAEGTKERRKMIKGYSPYDLSLLPFVKVVAPTPEEPKIEEPKDEAPTSVIEKDENGNPVEVDAE